MTGTETRHWKFHHLGVIVGDMDRAVDYYRSLGFVDFPREPERPATPAVWEELVTYGETVLRDGKLLVSPREGSRPARIQFCSVGAMTLELIQPGEAIRDVNGDFLDKNGEGIDHIAYTVDAAHFEQEVEKMKAKGLPILLSGRQPNGGAFVYFDTRKAGGIIIELMRPAG